MNDRRTGVMLAKPTRDSASTVHADTAAPSQQPSGISGAPDSRESGDPRKTAKAFFPSAPAQTLDEYRDGGIPEGWTPDAWAEYVSRWVEGRNALAHARDVLRRLVDEFNRQQRLRERTAQGAGLRNAIDAFVGQINLLEMALGAHPLAPWEDYGRGDNTVFGGPDDGRGESHPAPDRPGEGSSLGGEQDGQSGDARGPILRIEEVVVGRSRGGSRKGNASPGTGNRKGDEGGSNDRPESGTSGSTSSSGREPRESHESYSARSDDQGGSKASDASTGERDREYGTNVVTDAAGSAYDVREGDAEDELPSGDGNGDRRGDDVRGRIKVAPLPRGVTQHDVDLIGPLVKTKTGADDKDKPDTGSRSGTAATNRDPDDLGNDLPGRISSASGPDAGKLKIKDPRPLNPIDPPKM